MAVVRGISLFLGGALTAWVLSLLVVYVGYLSAADGLTFPVAAAVTTVAVLVVTVLGARRISHRDRLSLGLGACAYGLAIALAVAL